MAATRSHTRTSSSKNRERAQLESQAWGLLGELFMKQRPRMMALCREFDLFPPQLMVLKTLDQPRPMSEVAATLACDSSNLTGITDRLEERGLVRREADPNDRRVKLLVLSKEGEKLRREVVRRMNQPPPGAVDALSEREIQTLQGLLNKALSKD